LSGFKIEKLDNDFDRFIYYKMVILWICFCCSKICYYICFNVFITFSFSSSDCWSFGFRVLKDLLCLWDFNYLLLFNFWGFVFTLLVSLKLLKDLHWLIILSTSRFLKHFWSKLLSFENIYYFSSLILIFIVLYPLKSLEESLYAKEFFLDFKIWFYLINEFYFDNYWNSYSLFLSV
jgi:hypothetical protein